MDKNSGGTVTKTTVYYPAGGAMRVNGTLYYVLKDHLGSASVVTDNSGNVVGDQRYYPFGFTRLATGSMYTDKLFTAQREMAGLGIYHFGARFYSPYINRFLSADSIVPNPFNPQDFNRYSYVRNNPIRYIDPSGHFICSNDRNSDDYCPGRTSIIGSNGSSSGGGGGGGGGPLGGASGGGGGGGNPNIPTTIPTPVCTSPTNDCATSIAASQLTPTVTMTPTQPFVICGNYNQPCPLTTVTPFAQDIVVPGVERGVGLLNPFTPSYDPFDAQQFWDTVLRGVPPIFGLPASSFEGAVNYVVTRTGNAVRYVATTAYNAALDVSYAIGNATSNLTSAVSSVFETGIGPTLPIFILPAENFLFPVSSPAEEYY